MYVGHFTVIILTSKIKSCPAHPEKKDVGFTIKYKKGICFCEVISWLRHYYSFPCFPFHPNKKIK